MTKGAKFVIVLLFFLNIGTFLLFFFTNTQYFPSNETPMFKKVEGLEAMIKTQMRNEGLKLGISAVSDTLGKETPLLDYLRSSKNGSLFVCRFKETDCSSCIQYAVKVTQDVAQDIGFDNVLVVVSYNRKRLFNRQKNQLGLAGINVVYGNELALPAEAENFPYCFLLDSTLRVYNVFFPDKGLKDVTEKYVNLLIRQSNQMNGCCRN